MFSLFGFEVRIRPSFFLMAAILGMPRGFSPEEMARTGIWVVVVTVSILIHELGHAFAVRGLGGSATIELYALGGMARHQHATPLTSGQRAWISFAGPLAGLVLGGLVFLLGTTAVVAENEMIRGVQRQLLWVNLGWGALNLLPILPLDGGHILHAALDAITRGRGTLAAQVISSVVGVACAALAVSLGLYWAAVIAGWCVLSTVQGILRQGRDRHDRQLWEEFERVCQGYEEGEAQTLPRLRDLLSRARTEGLRTSIVESMIWLHLATDQQEEAMDLLRKEGPSFERADLLSSLDLRLFEAGHYRLAAEVGQMAFARSGDAVNAYNVACSHARLEGSEAVAVRWLHQAVNAGWDDLARLDEDPDFEALRHLPEYQAVRARIEPAKK